MYWLFASQKKKQCHTHYAYTGLSVVDFVAGDAVCLCVWKQQQTTFFSEYIYFISLLTLHTIRLCDLFSFFDPWLVVCYSLCVHVFHSFFFLLLFLLFFHSCVVFGFVRTFFSLTPPLRVWVMFICNNKFRSRSFHLKCITKQAKINAVFSLFFIVHIRTIGSRCVFVCIEKCQNSLLCIWCVCLCEISQWTIITN